MEGTLGDNAKHFAIKSSAILVRHGMSWLYWDRGTEHMIPLGPGGYGVERQAGPLHAIRCLGQSNLTDVKRQEHLSMGCLYFLQLSSPQPCRTRRFCGRGCGTWGVPPCQRVGRRLPWRAEVREECSGPLSMYYGSILSRLHLHHRPPTGYTMIER